MNSQPIVVRAGLCAGLIAVAAPASAQDAAVALQGLVVTANRMETPADQVGSAVTVITGEEMERRQIRFVADALRSVPGVAVTRGGSVGSLTEVRIRGAEANQTLVLIDGIEVNDPASGSQYDFANLLSADVERVEILRGPQGVLYGSDAVGGVVNVVTRRAGGKLSANASAEGGSFGTVTGNGSVAGSAVDNRLRWSLGGAGFRNTGISTASEHRGNSENDSYENATGFANLSGDLLENLELSLVGRVTDSERQGDAYFGGIGAVDAHEDSKTLQRFGRSDLRLRLLDDKWLHRIGVAIADTRTDYDSDGRRTSSFDGTRTAIDYQTDLSFDTQAVAAAAHTLTLGLQREQDEADSRSDFSTFDEDVTTQSVFGLYQLALSERLFLTGGLRYDDNDHFEDATTYRFTAAYLFSETGTKIRGSAGSGVKNPTLFELYGYTPTFVPNPDLKPEKSHGWDVGLDQRLLDDRLRLGATLFFQRIDDFIAFTGNSVDNVDGESKIHGLELEAGFDITPSLTLTASYTYTGAEDADGDELVRRPKNQGSLDLDYRFLDDRARLNASLLYVGGRDDFFYDAFYNQERVGLDSYTLVNIGGSYRLMDNIEIFGRVENVFDDNYEEVYTYGTPGRAGFAGLRIRL